MKQTVSLVLGPADYSMQVDGIEVASFDAEPDANSPATEFLRTLESRMSLWDTWKNADDPAQAGPLVFDDVSRELLENIRTLLDRLLWHDAERVKIYRLTPPLAVVNGTAVWAIRRLRDDHLLLHRQESIHVFAARCCPPNTTDPHPSCTPDEDPAAWAGWFGRNVGLIVQARAADYGTEMWYPHDWRESMLFPAYADWAPDWSGVDTKDLDKYALGA